MLVRESKLGPLLGGPEAPVALERAVALAEATPVYAPEFTRSWDRPPALVDRLLGWHASP